MQDDDQLPTGVDSPESLETGSALAPDTGENLEQNNTGEELSAEGGEEQAKDPSGYTKAIHKKHHQLMEERRAREVLQQENERLRSQVPQEQRPAIPAIPDQYDDDFTEQMEARDKAMQDVASFDARQATFQEQHNVLQQQAVQAQQQEAQQREQSFAERAKTAGISDNQLSTAIQTVNALGGIGVELASHLMENEQGGVITTFLAQNPEEILAIQNMTPMQGAVHINSVLQPKAAAAFKSTSAPPPPDSLGGGGAPPADEGPKGAVYE